MVYLDKIQEISPKDDFLLNVLSFSQNSRWLLNVGEFSKAPAIATRYTYIVYDSSNFVTDGFVLLTYTTK